MPHLRIRNLLLGVLTAAALGACTPSSTDDTAAGAAAPVLATSTQALSAQGAVASARKGPPDKDAVCTVTQGDDSVLVTGIVLAPEGVLRNGHVLYGADGVIQCVGKDCDKEAAALTATRIDCHKGVISPGLINGHDHVSYQDGPAAFTDERYEHRHDWRTGSSGHTQISSGAIASTAQMQWGELRQVFAGTTSLNGSGHASGLLRNLDRTGELLGAPEGVVRYETFPLADTSGTELTQGCKYAGGKSASIIPADAAFAPHVSEGIEASARNEFKCLSGQGPGSSDLMGPRTAIIHGIGLTAFDAAVLKLSGTSVIWSPRTNIALYGDTAQVGLYKAMGVNVALGTDWLRSGSMNMLRELQCADTLNATYFNFALTSEDLWKMATANAADALQVGESLGRLQAGKLADLAIYAGHKHEGDPYRAVIAAEPADVVLTIRGGKVLYGDAAVVDALAVNCDALDVCGVQKAACVRGELGVSLSSLQASNSDRYPLFSCAPRADEPTCVPQRASVNASFPASVNGSSVYTGTPEAVDVDGDSIPDVGDNCPAVFNPVRPMDDGKQADHDADGVGDACDPCPLSEGVEACGGLEDLDRDGVANAEDVCRYDANPDQADLDADGKGDACDACPEDANPGDAQCPAPTVTIYQAKSGAVSNGTPVRLRNVLVTARIYNPSSSGPVNNGVFVQVHEGEAGYQGPDWSGLYLFMGAGKPLPAVGDRIDVTGSMGTYFLQRQLTVSGGVFTVRSSGNAAPAPVVVAPSAIANGGARQKSLEGVVVQVQDVVVTNVTPSLGGGDRNPSGEFVVTEKASVGTPTALQFSVRVDNNAFYSYAMPTLGTEYASVSGVLAWRNDHSKIEVRSAADLVRK